MEEQIAVATIHRRLVMIVMVLLMNKDMIYYETNEQVIDKQLANFASSNVVQ